MASTSSDRAYTVLARPRNFAARFDEFCSGFVATVKLHRIKRSDRHLLPSRNFPCAATVLGMFGLPRPWVQEENYWTVRGLCLINSPSTRESGLLNLISRWKMPLSLFLPSYLSQTRSTLRASTRASVVCVATARRWGMWRSGELGHALGIHPSVR